jgi:SagB-type dehydrogenase family enzyme
VPAARHVKTERRVRRSQHLVLYWRRERLIVHNYATGARVQADPLLCRLLDYCSDWRTADDIRLRLGLGSASVVRTLLARLLSRGLLDRSDRPESPQTAAMATLDRWNPEAGFFHTATKNVRFWSPLDAARQSRIQAASWPMPAPVKRYRGSATIDLPKPRRGEFGDVLLGRRTWRRFSSAPVAIDDLATVLGLSAGVQRWVRTPAGEVPLKTSPSGGARHPIECYVIACRVAGLRPGVYHYASDRHALERLRGRVSPERIASYYPSSPYFAKAPVQVFFTAVFERQVWRYPYARAYRAALAEAGHVCQTFCLSATWLGLAPFCLMGLADSLIEGDLGLDGVRESVLYAAGLGLPPKGVTWAPLAPKSKGTLKTRLNKRIG